MTVPWAASASTVFPSGHTSTLVIIPREPYPGDAHIHTDRHADRSNVRQLRQYRHKQFICTISSSHCPTHVSAPPTLCNCIRLHVSVVVLTCPHEPSLALHGLRHHVVYQTVLVPDACSVKLGLVVPEGGQEGRGVGVGG